MSLLRDLREILSTEQILSDELDRLCYSYDSSFISRLHSFCPDAVVLPRSVEETAAVIKYAAQQGIPIVPRGAGSGESGGAVPVQGGIVMDLSTWKDVVELDVANMQILVRPGLVHAELNRLLAPHGLFFPPDPGSSKMATIGGMVANNSSGLRAIKYGVTENYVLGLEVVLPDGRVITTGGQDCRAIKNVSGLNLTKLFVGSEGVLGVITGVRLRLWPRPQSRGIVMAAFPKLEDAPKAVMAVFQAGMLPSGMEIMDSSAIEAVNLYHPQLKLPAAEAILLFEVDGNPPGVAWQVDQIRTICQRWAVEVEEALEEERMTQLWEGRSLVAAAVSRLRSEGTRAFIGEDISVPLSRVPEALRGIKSLADKHQIKVVLFGHIGDGNLHTAPVIDPDDEGEVARVQHLADDIHRLALKLQGTVTGEHGIGFVRSQYARQEHGPALDVMVQVKRALDPLGIMNPGKIFPSPAKGAGADGKGTASTAQ